MFPLDFSAPYSPASLIHTHLEESHLLQVEPFLHAWVGLSRHASTVTKGRSGGIDGKEQFSRWCAGKWRVTFLFLILQHQQQQDITFETRKTMPIFLWQMVCNSRWEKKEREKISFISSAWNSRVGREPWSGIGVSRPDKQAISTRTRRWFDKNDSVVELLAHSMVFSSLGSTLLRPANCSRLNEIVTTSTVLHLKVFNLKGVHYFLKRAPKEGGFRLS